MFILIAITTKMFQIVFSPKTAVILTGVSLVGLSIGYQGGNLTEEYILPFLMLSFYGFWRWADNSDGQQIEHASALSCLYGITFGVAFMTRFTNAIGICFIMLFTAVTFMKNRRWRELIIHIGAFILGYILVVLPFVIYFARQGALYEMWFGTIEFNFSYVKNSYKIIQHNSVIRKIFSFLLYFFSSYCMAFVGILMAVRKERRFMGGFMIMTSVVTTAMFAVGRGYPHYCMICLPYFVISMLELRKMNKRNLFVFYLVLYLAGGVWGLKGMYRAYTEKENAIAIENIMSAVSEGERDSFIAWSCPPYLYLAYDIEPCYRYFIIQSNQAEMNRGLKESICETFQEGNAEWILVQEGTQRMIWDTLESQYEVVKREEGDGMVFVLYHKKHRIDDIGM